MKATDLFEAIGRGIVQQLLADVPATDHPGKPPASTDKPPGESSSPEAPSVIHADLPTPSFDPLNEPLPGFEDIPPATLAKMQEAIDKITRGEGIPPGMYAPEDADSRVPLS